MDFNKILDIELVNKIELKTHFSQISLCDDKNNEGIICQKNE